MIESNYDKVVVEIAKEFFDVWREAKSTTEDDWDDVSWESLTENHKTEYRKTAQRIIDLIKKYLAGELVEKHIEANIITNAGMAMLEADRVKKD